MLASKAAGSSSPGKQPIWRGGARALKRVPYVTNRNEKLHKKTEKKTRKYEQDKS